MIKKLDIPLVLLAIAGFLAPLIGGQVAVDSLAMTPGSDPWISALMGASETPTLSHAILALLCTSALAVMLLQRKILQVPNNTVSGLLMALLGLILTTVSISSFRGASIPAAMEWLTYGITLFAVVAAGGRQRGPMLLLSSIFAGCVVLAWLGIREYGNMKAIDPTWRIFPQWVGPNAMAAILTVGIFLGLGQALNAKKLASLGVSIGCVAIGLAIFLSQSKGALVALLGSLFIFALLLVLWLPKKEIGRAVAMVGGTIGVVALLAIALSAQPKAATQATNNSPGARFLNAGATADQSVGFRKLLWKSSLKLMQQSPTGVGIGTFQFESARPGLTTQTHFAHQAYLQLGAEASVIAPLLLISALGFWGLLLLRGGRKLQSPQNVMRASVFAAVASVAMHSLIDSDFSYYGVGLIVFMLIGLGLLLSSDAVAPEFLPSALRRIAAFGVSSVTLFLLFLGITEASRGQARGLMTTGAGNDARSRLESLRSSAPWDGDIWYMSALVTQEANVRLAYAVKAVELAPSTRNLRFLARLEAGAGRFSDALSALQRAAQTDPNNLNTLTQLAELQETMGEFDKATETLKVLVKVEQTDYFKVRSLPELVETATYSARCRLAIKESDPAKKAALLQPAIDGFKQYLAVTVPQILRFANNADGPMAYGGEDIKAAEKKMAEALVAAKSLSDAYRAVGDRVKAGEADAAGAEFAKPIALPAEPGAAKSLDLPSAK